MPAFSEFNFWTIMLKMDRDRLTKDAIEFFKSNVHDKVTTTEIVELMVQPIKSKIPTNDEL